LAPVWGFGPPLPRARKDEKESRARSILKGNLDKPKGKGGFSGQERSKKRYVDPDEILMRRGGKGEKKEAKQERRMSYIAESIESATRAARRPSKPPPGLCGGRTVWKDGKTTRPGSVR